jgi:hypothetical protein
MSLLGFCTTLEMQDLCHRTKTCMLLIVLEQADVLGTYRNAHICTSHGNNIYIMRMARFLCSYTPGIYDITVGRIPVLW